MPDDAAAQEQEQEQERERAIVAEAIAALEGTSTGSADHPVERRRVRVVLDAVRDAR